MRIHAEPAIKSVLVTVPLFRQIDEEGLDALAAASTMSELPRATYCLARATLRMNSHS